MWYCSIITKTKTKTKTKGGTKMAEKCFVRTITEFEVTADIDSVSLTPEGEKQITTQSLKIGRASCRERV